jgi:hypothetical protein
MEQSMPRNESIREPVSPELRKFYDAERSLPPALGEDEVARILAAANKVAPTPAAPPDSADVAASASGSAATAKYTASTLLVASIASGLVGLAVGIGGSRLWSEQPHAATTHVGADASPSPDRVEVSEDLPIVPDAAPPPPPPEPDKRVEPASERNPAPATPPDVVARSERTADERNLIDRARSALARNQPHETMVALMQHERLYNEGVLREEREYLTVRALVAQGKLDKARVRAGAYEKTYPEGAYIVAIRKLLADFD